MTAVELIARVQMECFCKTLFPKAGKTVGSTDSSVRDNRKDTAQPAFSKPRSSPSFGGGGATTSWSLIALFMLLMLRRFKYKGSQRV